MTSKTIWLLLWIILFIASVAGTGDIRAANLASTQGNQGHKNIEGTVTKVSANSVSLDTGNGVIKTFLINKNERNGIRKCKVGDLILLDLDDDNQVVDISVLKVK